MKHLRAINKKAVRLEGQIAAARSVAEQDDIVALQAPAAPKPHVPMGCSIIFSPGWEVDSSGGTSTLR